MKSLCAISIALCTTALADPALRERLQDQQTAGQDHWIYNDLAAGFAKAKETGKPLFVTFRCVPCHACKEFDAIVAGENAEIRELAKRFVPVRQVEMKEVDLSQFQFDYDLNWAAMFLNADGTVYARYGTQSTEGPDAYNSAASLVKTMRRVLELHEKYPDNRSLLDGKRGADRPWKTALDMPGLPDKDKLRGQTERANCIHCHNIHDAEVLGAWDAGTYAQEMLWRYPYPENIGLEIDRSDGRRIQRAVPGSVLEKMDGLAGAELVEVNGQAITSVADIQWALHSLPREKEFVEFVTAQDGKTRSNIIPLPEGWRKTDISWRGSIWSVPPRLRIWLPEPDEKERAKHKLPEGTPAVVARWINTGEEAGRVATKAGLQTGDLIVEVDGKPVPTGNGAEFSTFVKLNYNPGQKLPLTVFRDGKRVQIELPLVK